MQTTFFSLTKYSNLANKRIFFISLLALAALHTARAESDHDDHDHDDHDSAEQHEGHDHNEHEEHEEVVILTPELQKEFGITTAIAGPGTLHKEVTLPGEIQYNREQIAYVTPRFSGTVLEIQARLADQVTKGQILAELESNDSLRPFTVVAPFDGILTAYDVTPGETVEAGKPLFTIADLSTVWADLQVYQRDMSKIKKGQSVVITSGQDGPDYNGTISYIAPVIDEHTRTGLARVVVENDNDQWKPGQFIKGKVAINEHNAAIVVPLTAITTYEGGPVVFVETDEGFEPHPVHLGISDSESIEVLEGLEAGDTYVTQNVISLKAELSKGSFGGHAGHVH